MTAFWIDFCESYLSTVDSESVDVCEREGTRVLCARDSLIAVPLNKPAIPWNGVSLRDSLWIYSTVHLDCTSRRSIPSEAAHHTLYINERSTRGDLGCLLHKTVHSMIALALYCIYVYVYVYVYFLTCSAAKIFNKYPSWSNLESQAKSYLYFATCLKVGAAT
jgi:hypothetical protein